MRVKECRALLFLAQPGTDLEHMHQWQEDLMTFHKAQLISRLILKEKEIN